MAKNFAHQTDRTRCARVSITISIETESFIDALIHSFTHLI